MTTLSKKQRKMRNRILIAAALLILVKLLPLTGWVRGLCCLAPYFIIGYDVLRKAALGIVNGQVFDENFLMALATVGAYATGEFDEAVFVMLFYQTGELFQRLCRGQVPELHRRPDGHSSGLPPIWKRKDGLEHGGSGGCGRGLRHRGEARRAGTAGRYGVRGQFHTGYRRPHRRIPAPRASVWAMTSSAAA